MERLFATPTISPVLPDRSDITVHHTCGPLKAEHGGHRHTFTEITKGHRRVSASFPDPGVRLCGLGVLLSATASASCRAEPGGRAASAAARTMSRAVRSGCRAAG